MDKVMCVFQRKERKEQMFDFLVGVKVRRVEESVTRRRACSTVQSTLSAVFYSSFSSHRILGSPSCRDTHFEADIALNLTSCREVLDVSGSMDVLAGVEWAGTGTVTITGLHLHSWSGPDTWGLPAIDSDTVFVASLLQRTLLGRWTLSESNDPDASPNGQLPYLEHGSRKISSLPSIISYLSTLSPSSTTPTPQPATRGGDHDQKSTSASLSKGEDIDKDLSKTQKAELVAWKSVIQSELADLTTFTLYSSDRDYDLLFNHLASSLPFPQAHYVPQRLRALHQARLEHVGLWALRATDEPLNSVSSRWKTQPLGVMSTERVLPPLERASNERKESTAGKFGTQRLLDQSSLTLGLLSNFLGSADYFFDSSKPTTLDLYLFAQLSLILLPPFTQSVIANQIRTTYPNLQAHTLRILSSCFPPESPTVWPHRDASLGKLSAWEYTKRSIEAVPRVGRAWFGATPSREKSADEIEESRKNAAFSRKRWLWFVGVGVTFVTYIFASGLVQIGGDEEEYEVEEDEDE